MRSFKFWAIAALALSACGGDDNKSTSFTVGGTLSDLTGTVVLTNNGGDDLTLTQNGAFTFATSVAQGGAYLVAVKTPPASQTCSVANGSGTVGNANVTNVTVTCTTNATPTHTVGGTVTGATGTIVLTNNGGDALTLDGDDSFTFTTPVAEGATYDVDVETPPANQTCEVANDSGTMGSANVTNVTVTCTTNASTTHTIGGTLSGLGGSIELTNSGGDNLTLTQDGVFTFATHVAEGVNYDVEIATPPASQNCSLANNTGQVGTADVTDVTVTCAWADGFGTECTTSDDCPAAYPVCELFGTGASLCTKSCAEPSSPAPDCPPGRSGEQRCNNSNVCRPPDPPA